MELDKLRLSRMKNAGCSCTFGRCNSETCECFAIGLPCIEGNCSCMRCMNPYERPCEDDDDMYGDLLDTEGVEDESEEHDEEYDSDDMAIMEEYDDLGLLPPKKKKKKKQMKTKKGGESIIAPKEMNKMMGKPKKGKKKPKSKKRKLVWITQKE